MKPFFSTQIQAFKSLVRPPFEGLWLAALIYFFWSFLAYPNSQIIRGNLPDPDDYMYLNAVLDWIKGQSWFDPLQHRLDPPSGGVIQFSRLAQMPMAGMILLLEFFGLPQRGAALVMAVFEPLILFAALFFVMKFFVARFIGRLWAGASAYVMMFATGLLAMFAPGHVDHHGLVVLLIMLSLLSTVRMMQESESDGFAILAGFLLALSLTIALEVLPWLIVITSFVGFWALAKKDASRQGILFGLSLFVSAASLLAVTRRPNDYFTVDLVAFSIVYVSFCGSLASILAAIHLASPLRFHWRLTAATALSILMGLCFFVRFPELVSGPYGGVDPSWAQLMLDNVSEAKPLVLLKGGLWPTLLGLLQPLLAIAASLYFLLKAQGEKRWPLALMASLLITAFLLSVFYQFRFVGMLGAFTILPLTMFLYRGWRRIGVLPDGRTRTVAEIGLLLLIGPLPSILVPGVVDGRSFNKGIILYPVHTDGSARCDMYGLEKVLHSDALYGGRPRVIMNTMGLGPELLFRTADMVLSAPYHEVVAGNLDAVRFFADTDAARAEKVARRWHADLVVACKLVPGIYTDLAAVRRALPDLAPSMTSAADPEPPMILRLITGQRLPSWLIPVSSPLISQFVVYEIAPPKTQGDK